MTKIKVKGEVPPMEQNAAKALQGLSLMQTVVSQVVGSPGSMQTTGLEKTSPHVPAALIEQASLHDVNEGRLPCVRTAPEYFVKRVQKGIMQDFACIRK